MFAAAMFVTPEPESRAIGLSAIASLKVAVMMTTSPSVTVNWRPCVLIVAFIGKTDEQSVVSRLIKAFLGYFLRYFFVPIEWELAMHSCLVSILSQ